MYEFCHRKRISRINISVIWANIMLLTIFKKRFRWYHPTKNRFVWIFLYEVYVSVFLGLETNSCTDFAIYLDIS